MPPTPPSESTSFFDGPFGSIYPPIGAIVINRAGMPDETRTPVKAGVLGDVAYFDVDAPVYEGDHLELPDPRGGTKVAVVTELKTFDTRGGALASLGYAKANLVELAAFRAREEAARREAAANAPNVFTGPSFHIGGDGHVNAAWGGGSASGGSFFDKSSVPGAGDLAAALRTAVEIISNSADLAGDDQEIGVAAAEEAVGELTKSAPDRRVLKRALATVRGILMQAVNAATNETVRILIAKLFVDGPGS